MVFSRTFKLVCLERATNGKQILEIMYRQHICKLRGTALQGGKSRIRFSMVSLEFFIDVIFPATLCTRDRLNL